MTFITFLLAATLLAITPGSGIAYVVARTAAGGRAQGLASCIGTGLGGMVHVLAAALGFSALVAQSATVFNTMKYLGAAYLLYLGIRMLLQARNTLTLPNVPEDTAVTKAQGSRKALLEGIMVEALNVKTALFFLAFLPQFITPNQAVIPQMVLLGSICVLLNTLVDVLAVFAAQGILRTGEQHASRARRLNQASGLTMIGLAFVLLFAKKQTA